MQVPIDVYRVVLPWTQGAPGSARRRTSAKAWRRPTLAALAAIILVAAGVTVWRYQRATPQASPASLAAHAEDRKSVAVLPFVNMSSDKENEYFSDGITEDLITALSKVSGLHVASRTSAFAFKGRSEDIQKIGEQLRVGAVLEGSVAKAGNQVRITAQLINAADGYHLWSDSYDRELQDIFAIRSQVAQTVAKALQVTLGAGEVRTLEQKPTKDLEAYQLYLKGRHATTTLNDWDAAIHYLQQAGDARSKLSAAIRWNRRILHLERRLGLVATRSLSARQRSRPQGAATRSLVGGSPCMASDGALVVRP
jgi:TolB-like protein